MNLRVNKERVRDDFSTGCNSSASHAENKHDILINRTKTPKLGMQHLKTTMTQKSTKPIVGKLTSQHLSRQNFT